MDDELRKKSVRKALFQDKQPDVKKTPSVSKASQVVSPKVGDHFSVQRSSDDAWHHAKIVQLRRNKENGDRWHIPCHKQNKQTTDDENSVPQTNTISIISTNFKTVIKIGFNVASFTDNWKICISHVDNSEKNSKLHHNFDWNSAKDAPISTR